MAAARPSFIAQLNIADKLARTRFTATALFSSATALSLPAIVR